MMKISDYIIIFFVLFAVLVTIWREINNHLVTQESKKSAQYKALVDKSIYLNNLAAAIVASVAVNPQITKSESMDAALSKFTMALSSKGIDNVSSSVARAFLESNYQAYKQSKGDQHQDVTVVTNDAIDKMLDSDVKAPAPAAKD